MLSSLLSQASAAARACRDNLVDPAPPAAPAPAVALPWTAASIAAVRDQIPLSLFKTRSPTPAFHVSAMSRTLIGASEDEAPKLSLRANGGYAPSHGPAAQRDADYMIQHFSATALGVLSSADGTVAGANARSLRAAGGVDARLTPVVAPGGANE